MEQGACDRPKVLVLWSDQRSPNLGVRVLAAGAAALAHQVWENPTITFQDFAPNDQGFSLGKKSMIREAFAGEITRWISQFDIVLDTGAGDSFSDIYGLDRLLMMYVTQRAAGRRDGSFVLMPQTIGPFDTRVGRSMARRTLTRAAAVYVRDSQSAAAARALGVTDVLSGTDVVFALPSVRAAKTRDVVLNVSGLLWHENRHVSSTAYQSETHRFIQSCRQAGRRITILPHVLDNPSDDNDAQPTEELSRRYGSDIEVVVPQSLEDARQIIASANVLVGARMHACLNALSLGTPAVAWAYSRKFAPLMEDLGWSAVVDLRSSSEVADETLNLLLRQDELELAVSTVRRQADLRVELVRQSLSKVRL